jgi:hypothetical protein
VNGNLLTTAASLSEEQLRSPFQIGQGSIWKSLVHLYAAEFVWLEALLGNDDPLIQGDLPGKLPGNQLGEGGITNLDDLQAKWIALEQRWNGYLASLTPESLDELVYKKSTSYGLGKRYAPRRSDVRKRPTSPSWPAACTGQTGLRVWPSAFGLLRDIEKRTQIFGRSLERCWGPAPGIYRFGTSTGSAEWVGWL